MTDTLRLTDPSTIPDGSPGPQVLVDCTSCLDVAWGGGDCPCYHLPCTSTLRLIPQHNHAAPLQPTQDILYRIEPMPPPKAAAVAYLDGHGPEPERFAHVITYRGTASPRDIMEYRVSSGLASAWMALGVLLLISAELAGCQHQSIRCGNHEIHVQVGPLPVSNTTTTVALRAPGEIPFVKHPVDSISGGWGQEAVGKVRSARRSWRLRVLLGLPSLSMDPGTGLQNAFAITPAYSSL